MSDHISSELRQITNVGRATFQTSEDRRSKRQTTYRRQCDILQTSEERRPKRRTTLGRNYDGLQASEERRSKRRTTFHRKCDSLQTSEARQFVRRRKSDACSEAMEEVSIVRHFLRASELRWHDKPWFVHPRTVALATTMCRNSDELAEIGRAHV